MKIIKGPRPGARKIVFYGPEGIGKSSIASKFPEPLFIDTEDSTKDMNVARFEKPSSWQMLKNQVQYVIDHAPGICRTLVIDTADWAERLEIEALCSKNGWDGLEGAGYGKGYTYSAEEFGRLLDLLSVVTEKGIHVVVTAHAQLRKVELPEEIGAYDHWEMKTSKKVAPMIREWADAVFFLNYKVNVVNIDNQGAAKGKNKAQGGRRVMYTAHTPFWDAKNRYGLPEELPLDYDAIAHVIEGDAIPDPAEDRQPVINRPEPVNPVSNIHGTDESSRAPEKPPVTQTIDDLEAVSAKARKSASEEKKKASKPVRAPVPVTPEQLPKVTDESLDKRIPKKLRDLMIQDNIDEWDIMNICEAKGYVPQGTKIWDYDVVNEGFIEGALIGFWDSVKKQIMEFRAKKDIPFE